MDELQWWFAIFIGYAFCCLFVIKCLLRSNAFVAFFVIIPKGHRWIDPLLPMFGKQRNWSLAVISYVLKYLDQKVAFVVATLWLGGWYQKDAGELIPCDYVWQTRELIPCRYIQSARWMVATRCGCDALSGCTVVVMRLSGLHCGCDGLSIAVAILNCRDQMGV